MRMKRWAVYLLLVLALIAALAPRLYRIASPPLEFHPTRQFHSALIARSLYLDSFASGDAGRAEVARQARADYIEPPIMEAAAAVAYWAGGGENLAYPRIISVLCWLAGAVLLYLICLEGISRDAALIAVAYFLLAPYTIPASRSFQPEPLMVAMMLAAVFAMLRYRRAPSARLFALTAGLSALAILVKPVAVFPLWPAFVLSGAISDGLGTTLRNRRTWLFAGISLLPSAVYYVYGLYVAGFLAEQTSGRFLPELLLWPEYWSGWLKQAARVVGTGASRGVADLVIGTAVLVAALVGVTLVRDRLMRGLVIGLLAGYALFGLVFTWHIHTHDYYSLLLVPIVAIPLGALLAEPLARARAHGRYQAALVWTCYAGILLLVAFTNGLRATRAMDWRAADSLVSTSREIGERIDHSTRTVMLARHYGKALMFYGETAGSYWPSRSDLVLDEASGKDVPDARQRLKTVIRRHGLLSNLRPAQCSRAVARRGSPADSPVERRKTRLPAGPSTMKKTACIRPCQAELLNVYVAIMPVESEHGLYAACKLSRRFVE